MVEPGMLTRRRKDGAGQKFENTNSLMGRSFRALEFTSTQSRCAPLTWRWTWGFPPLLATTLKSSSRPSSRILRALGF